VKKEIGGREDRGRRREEREKIGKWEK